ncbi:tripartite tricarboxylate transporter substrate binding protein [Stutzerimonas nosocomialis]|uniref:Tripartite tricarboxylate transporter substrate binding protein n=1 Tax=Stutzerimonas nosocomialis TaxID=1056496 RepID=A0A5R9QFM8_9GAMM|nr:tripartite tricarboxylate transporter substrate binding protein [Stutzerimonas nosocomialis]TLX56221.1 tripartite tricarboxylate transporter substrate binding protein [Stutzerimonas nosocomialis]TLX58583.1 tripartite tricarboxylate transporter substrate binding protein [Stutzerimonas nosocomialis]TLX63613.1 tripartite tricarboxylate transporter substrate binding protein [Stutzerimonas nosocomialis]
MKINKKLSAAILAATAAVSLSFNAQAEYVAGKDVTVLQGFKPGGGSDVLAQLVQPYVSKTLGINMVNEYIPGATGAIAWTRLAKQSKKDGTVISITNTPMLMTNYIMNDAITYNIKELTPIANVVTDPGIAVVAKDSPINSLEDLIAAAKEKPGRITVGNSGMGGDDYFTTLMVEKATGLSFKKVPFQGDGPSATAAMGNKIDVSFNNVGTVYSQVKSGNLKALAVFSEERIEDMPDVPTLKEKGIDVVAGSSRGYSAPAGIPDEARDQLIAAFEALRNDEAFLADAKKRALNIDIVTGDEYGAMFERMEKEFQGIWQDVADKQ